MPFSKLGLSPFILKALSDQKYAQPYPIRFPAPTLGQYTREILTRILALPESELNRLEAERIIGEAPIPTSERAPRSSAKLREALKT